MTWPGDPKTTLSCCSVPRATWPGAKLLPGLFHLHAAGLLPREYRVIGSAPASFALTGRQFRAHAREAAEKFGMTKPDDPSWTDFEQRLLFAIAEPGNADDLRAVVRRAEAEIGGSPRRLFHLAIPPEAFTSMVGMLGDSGLARGATRVIVEKPFGTDLASARALNQAVLSVFDESQVFHIDHFLGKESVDNILAFRFANGLFEPVWNRDHIRYVQIDVPETLSVEGRAAFYDATGAYRDMIVTHLFQVMGFVAMEPPVSLSSKPLRDEQVKVFGALKPLEVRHVVRGQYAGYRCEPGVAAGSDTETLAVVRAEVDNWRWQGCRSSCARARPWAPAASSSRSASTGRRCGCSARTFPTLSAGSTRSSSTSPIPARSAPSS
jgi:glucose-6-phosphate 1-dehydrogenase